MDYFICYDIADSHRRRQIKKTIEDYGYSIQKSAFLCDLDQNTKSILLEKLLANFDDEKDSLMIYPLHKSFSNSKTYVRGVYEFNTFAIF